MTRPIVVNWPAEQTGNEYSGSSQMNPACQTDETFPLVTKVLQRPEGDAIKVETLNHPLCPVSCKINLKLRKRKTMWALWLGCSIDSDDHPTREEATGNPNSGMQSSFCSSTSAPVAPMCWKSENLRPCPSTYGPTLSPTGTCSHCYSSFPVPTYADESNGTRTYERRKGSTMHG